MNLANTGSWNIVFGTQSFTVGLTAGNNTIRVQGTSGGSCRQDKLCVVGTGSGGGCTTPAAPTLNANPSTITTSGGSSTLTASGCVSGGTITWSTGSTNSSITVSPSSQTTYTATCSKDGCTSATASVTGECRYQWGHSFIQPVYRIRELRPVTHLSAATLTSSNGGTRGDENNYNKYVDYCIDRCSCCGQLCIDPAVLCCQPISSEYREVGNGTPQTVNLVPTYSWNIVHTHPIGYCCSYFRK